MTHFVAFDLSGYFAALASDEGPPFGLFGQPRGMREIDAGRLVTTLLRWN